MTDDLKGMIDDIKERLWINISPKGLRDESEELLQEALDCIEALEARLEAADRLAEATENCLHMMDDVIVGIDNGDMNITPEGRTIVEGWKRLTAYRKAQEGKG